MVYRGLNALVFRDRPIEGLGEVVMSSTSVIIEPDSASAWIGLAGVAVGVLLTGSLELLRSRLTQRSERQREANQAVSELRASASSLIAYLMGYPRNDLHEETALAAMKAILMELGKLQQAAWVVARTTPRLAEAAWRVDREAAGSVGVSGARNIGSLRDSLIAFTDLVRQGDQGAAKPRLARLRRRS